MDQDKQKKYIIISSNPGISWEDLQNQINSMADRGYIVDFATDHYIVMKLQSWRDR